MHSEIVPFGTASGTAKGGEATLFFNNVYRLYVMTYIPYAVLQLQIGML